MKKTKYNNTFNQKLHRDFCEVCGYKEKSTLQHHHIIERTELNTSNDIYNLCVLCSNCHNEVHADRIKLIGVYPSTAPHGRMLIYEKNGIPNVEGITEPYYKPQPPQSKIYGVDDE